jgi:hypothetical protein
VDLGPEHGFRAHLWAEFQALELVQHQDRLFTLSKWVKPINQDLEGAQVFWAGELTSNNRRKHFQLTSVTA